MTEALELLARLNGFSGLAIFGVVLIALIKLWPGMRKLSIDSATQIRQELMDQKRICEDENRALRIDVNTLYEKMNAMRAQHLQEQVGLIAILAPNLSPEIQHALKALYAVREATENAAAAMSSEPLWKEPGSDARFP